MSLLEDNAEKWTSWAKHRLLPVHGWTMIEWLSAENDR